MTQTTHNGIPVIIYTREETRLIDFYESNKNKTVDEVSKATGMTQHEARQRIEAGKNLLKL